MLASAPTTLIFRPRAAVLHVDAHGVHDRHGQTHPHPGAEHAAALAAAGGRPVTGSRDQIAENMRPAERADVTAALTAPDLLERYAPADAATHLDALCGLAAALGDVPAADAAAYLHAINQIAYRDHLAVALAPDHPMPGQAEVLTGLAQSAPAGHAYVIAAITHLLTGDGVRAQIALDHGQAADPDNTLARLLRAAVTRGLPPQELRALLRTPGL